MQVGADVPERVDNRAGAVVMQGALETVAEVATDSAVDC